ncbi:peptide deformylase [Saccharopolyspora hordei]|uniref:Peptide deformylase n=1 Tax=Saccharopolyspora hordei TaxID=1838 RepID=A0A853AHK8_9PSEU|nr:peptide deformylase [Saccharopolyspora hordei]
MAHRPIRLFGDPVLRMPADPVTVFDQRLRTIVADLLDTVDAPGHAGVAAPQIGIGVRAFSYNVDGEIGYVINPEVVELSEKTQDGVEACLSLPGLGFDTRRAQHAVVRGVDVDNEPVTVSGSGLMARCLQHETDHLDGTVYIQRLDPAARREAFRQVREQEWFWQR